MVCYGCYSLLWALWSAMGTMVSCGHYGLLWIIVMCYYGLLWVLWSTMAAMDYCYGLLWALWPAMASDLIYVVNMIGHSPQTIPNAKSEPITVQKN